MNTPRVIHSFPTAQVTNNDVRYAVTFTFIAAAVVYAAVTFLQTINPFAMSAIGSSVITVFSVSALILVVNRSFANARKNEKNRLSFSQQVRHLAKNKLQRPITLEQVNDLAAGRTVTLSDFQIWLVREGSTTTLITNKRIGTLAVATAW